MAGVPFAAMIADRIERPLVIVRKQGKGFGRLAQFEGHFDPGSKVLLVDDLATDGISKLAFRAALERAEAEVTWTFVLFDYDVFRSDADLASLAKLHHVVDYMAKTNAIDPQALVDLQNFAANAPRWSRAGDGWRHQRSAVGEVSELRLLSCSSPTSTGRPPRGCTIC